MSLHFFLAPPGVLGIDNFNDYYPVSLKRARQVHAKMNGVYTVDGDINDMDLLQQLFDICKFTHIVHLAAQVSLHRHHGDPSNASSAGCI